MWGRPARGCDRSATDAGSQQRSAIPQPAEGGEAACGEGASDYDVRWRTHQ
jgi:hypothetical protein